MVCKIAGGRHLMARMSGFGIREGTRIRLIRSAPFQGPLLVEVMASGAKVMIGQEIAQAMEVSPEKAR